MHSLFSRFSLGYQIKEAANTWVWYFWSKEFHRRCVRACGHSHLKKNKLVHKTLVFSATFIFNAERAGVPVGTIRHLCRANPHFTEVPLDGGLPRRCKTLSFRRHQCLRRHCAFQSRGIWRECAVVDESRRDVYITMNGGRKKLSKLKCMKQMEESQHCDPFHWVPFIFHYIFQWMSCRGEKNYWVTPNLQFTWPGSFVSVYLQTDQTRDVFL